MHTVNFDKITDREFKLRNLYSDLHVTLNQGVEQNGFNPKNKFEAISLLSALFGSIMSEEFMGEYLNIFRLHHSNRDQDVLLSSIRVMMMNIISNTERDARDLNVSEEFIKEFMGEVNGEISVVFLSSLAALQLGKTEDSTIKKATEELRTFLEKCIWVSKTIKSGSTFSNFDLPYLIIGVMAILSAVVLAIVV